MKVSLIGFMGSGKSSVGRELSNLLNLPYVDLDQEIVVKTGKSIPSIFKELGEEGFRELERELLLNLLKSEGSFVLSTGGGTPAYRDSIELINRYSESFYLKTPFNVLWKRIEKDTNRPLVALGIEKVRELYRKREDFYKRAKFTINCEGKTPLQVAREIASKLSLL